MLYTCDLFLQKLLNLSAKKGKTVSRLPHLAQKQNYANCPEKAISRKLISQKNVLAIKKGYCCVNKFQDADYYVSWECLIMINDV